MFFRHKKNPSLSPSFIEREQQIDALISNQPPIRPMNDESTGINIGSTICRAPICSLR